MDTKTHSIRSMKAGQWYWMMKAVIQHYAAQIGFSALAVYNVLASMADEAQQCFPSQKYIADHLGCSRATVNRGIKILEQHHLIRVEKRKYKNHLYTLLEVPCNKDEPCMLHERNLPVQKSDTNNTHKQKINNNNVVRVTSLEHATDPLKSQEQLLASDIARALDDQTHLATYTDYARTYPEAFLRNILSEVNRTPRHKIKKSRSALFKYLVHYYAHKNS
ncbi:MAG: helix-turn-helix domain-containing protein [Ignavibacteriaceae bacterium]